MVKAVRSYLPNVFGIPLIGFIQIVLGTGIIAFLLIKFLTRTKKNKKSEYLINDVHTAGIADIPAAVAVTDRLSVPFAAGYSLDPTVAVDTAEIAVAILTAADACCVSAAVGANR